MNPVLSIAMLFKNEIRCLERCMESLLPLRERLSCELVMADTGSDDGSRAVAEKYADTVFDFPWVNDFAAARNAVLERCTGRWVLTIDCDEWLDPEAEELIGFLSHPASENYISAMLTVRSYLDTSCCTYSDGLLKRLLRRGAHPSFTGAIHERPVFGVEAESVAVLASVMLHHDGYIAMNDDSEAGKSKRERNQSLLREEIKRNPDDFGRIHQYLESGGGEDYPEVLRHSMELLREKRGGWLYYGAAILKTASLYGYSANAPELEKWLALADELFPDSWQTRIDIETVRMLRAEKREDAAGVIEHGERYLAACADYDAVGAEANLGYGTLLRANRYYRQYVRLRVADAYRQSRDAAGALRTLGALEWTELDEDITGMALAVLAKVSGIPSAGTAALMRSFWVGIAVEIPDAERAASRKLAFLRNGAALFDASSGEAAGIEPWRIFLPLQGSCPLGDAAALLAAKTAEDADAVLARFEDFTLLPGRALAHGLELGAAFPLPGRLLTVETADALAGRLAADREQIRSLAMFSAWAAEDEADVLWACSLVRSAMRAADWGKEANPMELLTAFVHIESLFLPCCYAEDALRNPALLPPEHRFGLHLLNAFSVLWPVSVSSDFSPTFTGGLRAALRELKEAVRAVPIHKAAIDRFLDDLTKRSG